MNVPKESSFMVYRSDDGLLHPVYEKPASKHKPPIPDTNENRSVLDILRRWEMRQHERSS